jgi:hypothetical protein
LLYGFILLLVLGAVVGGLYFLAQLLLPKFFKKQKKRKRVDSVQPVPRKVSEHRFNRPSGPEKAPVVDEELRKEFNGGGWTGNSFALGRPGGGPFGSSGFPGGASIRPSGPAKYVVTSAGKVVVFFEDPENARKTDMYSRAAARIGYEDDSAAPQDTGPPPRPEGIGPHGFRLPRRNLALTEGSNVDSMTHSEDDSAETP